jgi:hypothetical protein
MPCRLAFGTSSVGGHANPIDTKLRGCDVVALRVEDIAPNGYSVTMVSGFFAQIGSLAMRAESNVV